MIQITKDNFQQIHRGPRNAWRSHKKLILSIATIIIVAAGIFLSISLFSKTSPQNRTNSLTPPNQIRLIATGDFIAHDTLNERAKTVQGSYDYLQFMNDFKPIFAGADIRFCNQATVSAGESFGISGYPVFNAPTQFAKDMGSLGCNLINTASNHSFDKGQGAIDSTLKVWDSVPNLLAVAGENRSADEQAKIRYFDVKGTKFAFLAYTTYSNTNPGDSYGVNMYSNQFAKNQVEQARNNGAQIIIVSMRWGTEYSANLNDQQNQVSQFLADQGVNLVLGHGPHVLQAVKRLAGSSGSQTLVWYSLGNFLNTQEPSETLFNGLAVIDFDAKTHQISSAGYLPIYMHYEWTPAQKAADDLLSRTNLHLYLLDDANQALIDKNQLPTTVDAQRTRIRDTINAFTTIPLITKAEYTQ